MWAAKTEFGEFGCARWKKKQVFTGQPQIKPSCWRQDVPAHANNRFWGRAGAPGELSLAAVLAILFYLSLADQS